MTDSSDDNVVVLDAIRKAREMEALRRAMFSGHPSTRRPPPPGVTGPFPEGGGLPGTTPTTEQEPTS